jgi:tRNA C32,U32 (ribose-2'-O)-methylase TrmJ
VLGPERAGLSDALLGRCDHVVRIPTRFALNLAVAGALVLYDRLLQHGRFADRPVGSMGVAEALPATGHGAPRFRRTVPDWLHVDAKKP